MPKKVPDCRSCDFCLQKPVNRSRTLYDWCTHPMWMLFKPTGIKWIPSKERGKTSPKWCPKRIEIREETHG